MQEFSCPFFERPDIHSDGMHNRHIPWSLAEQILAALVLSHPNLVKWNGEKAQPLKLEMAQIPEAEQPPRIL